MAPPCLPDEAESRSHPPYFSNPREEKGELAHADSEELQENENNFQKEVLSHGQGDVAGVGARGTQWNCWSFPSTWVGDTAGSGEGKVQRQERFWCSGPARAAPSCLQKYKHHFESWRKSRFLVYLL